MKTASRDLFDLIQIMTASEKRYFRQFAQRHQIGEENQYLLLFDAVVSMQQYDEQLLKEQMKDKAFASHFAVTKGYLYKQLLESLHHYHLNQELESRILKELQICRLLLEKKLIQQAEKHIKKLTKKIEKYQLGAFSPLLIQLQRRLLQSKKQYAAPKLMQSFQELNIKLQQLKTENDYWLKSQKILGLHLQKIKLQNKKQEDQLEEVAQQLQRSGLPENPRIQIHYLKALATYHFMKAETEIAANYNQKLLELFEQETYLMELEKEQYIASFNNYLIDNHILGRFEALEKGVERLRTLSKEKPFKNIPNMEVKVMELTYSLQLNARIKQNQFRSALELLAALKKQLKKHQKTIGINYQLSLHYLMAYIYFENQDYEASLIEIEFLKQAPYKNIMQELQYAADRLILINHLSLKNYRLLDSLVDNTRRAHRQKKINSKLEEVLFKGVKKIVSAPNEKKRLQQFEQMKKNLQNLKEEEARAWNYFNFDRWELP